MAAKMSTEDMIKEALAELAERGGSSLPKIKKFLTERHHMDFEAGKDKNLVLKVAPRAGGRVGVEGGSCFWAGNSNAAVGRGVPAPRGGLPAAGRVSAGAQARRGEGCV